MTDKTNNSAENFSTVDEKQLIKLIKWRLLPLAFILYFFNGMDRLNIGFAALQMNSELNITEIEFGMIASTFFLSYLIFQIPSNILIQKLKINRWIGFIVIGWGAVTSLTFFAQTYQQVLILRFLLGVFEAGFFPGMMYFFSLWFPANEKAKVTAIFMGAAAVSGVIAAPLSGWIVQNISWGALSGWRWLFMIEGLPTVLFGLITMFYLTNKPQEAKWLTEPQRKWLSDKLEQERLALAQKTVNIVKAGWKETLSSSILWRLSLIYFFAQAASQVAIFWLPKQIKEFDASQIVDAAVFSNAQIGYVMMLPFLAGAIFMQWWSARCDRTMDRKNYTAIPMLIEAIAFLMIVGSDNTFVKILGVILFGVGQFGYFGPFWALCYGLLPPSLLAVGVAMINASSSLGGYVGNQASGFLSSKYGSPGVYIFEAMLCLIAYIMVMTIRTKKPVAIGERQSA